MKVSSLLPKPDLIICMNQPYEENNLHIYIKYKRNIEYEPTTKCSFKLSFLYLQFVKNALVMCHHVRFKYCLIVQVLPN